MTQVVKAPVISTQGDLIIGDAAGEATRLAKGTSGKFLKAGASTASWETITTADISGLLTGSGTATKLAKFTGTTAIGDSVFADDGTNAYIGTATTNSDAKLFNIVNTNDSHFAMFRNSANANAPRLYGYKSRGSYGSESDVTNSDQILSIVAMARSTSYFETGRIQFEIDGTFTTNQRPPGRIIFQTGINNGAITTALTLNATQQAIFASNVGIGTGSETINGLLEVTSDASATAMTLSNHFSDTNSAILRIRKSRGTNTSPTAIVNGDVLSSIVASGYPGTAYFDTARIDVVCNQTVSNNQRPSTQMDFYTSVANGTAVLAFRLDQSKDATFFGTIFPIASTSSKASINIPEGTTVSSPVVGDIWHDSTQNVLSMRYLASGSGYTANMPGIIWTMSGETTVTAASDTNLIANAGVGTKTLPANFFVVGKMVKIKIRGILTAGSGGTSDLSIKIKLGSTSLGTAKIDNLSASTVYGFDFEGFIVCYTTGGSGTVKATTDIAYGSNVDGAAGTARNIDYSGVGTTTTIDTTASQAITVTAAWDSTSGSPTITAGIAYIEILN